MENLNAGGLTHGKLLERFLKETEDNDLHKAVFCQLGDDFDLIAEILAELKTGGDAFSGFIYTDECKEFAIENQKAIKESMFYFADCCYDNLFDYLKHLSIFKETKDFLLQKEVLAYFGGNFDDIKEFENLVYSFFAQYALEDVAFRFQNFIEENK